MGDPKWLAEKEVSELIDLRGAIAAVEAGMQLEAAGHGTTMEKTHVAWGDGHTLHAVGAALPGRGTVGTKTWAHTAGGATPLLLLWDSVSGRLRAIIEAFVLGQLRTAAVSAVATRWMATADASQMAIIGSGKQALPQVAAAVAVRPITRVRIFSPNQEHARALAVRIEQAQLGPAADVCGEVHEAVGDAAVVTTATRARDPFLHGAMLATGAHVNAIGAITPERREVAADVLDRCTAIVADSPDAARRLSSELEGADAISALSDVVAAGQARSADADVTLFKAMGIGLADVALGAEILDRAEAEGAGRDLPQPEKAQPRLRS